MFKKVLSTTLVVAAFSATSLLTANAGVFDSVNNSLDKASASISKTSKQVKDAQAKTEAQKEADKKAKESLKKKIEARKEADKKAKEEAKKKYETQKKAEKDKVKTDVNKKLDNLLNKF